MVLIIAHALMCAARRALWKTGVTMAWQNSKDDIKCIEAVTAWQYIAVHPRLPYNLKRLVMPLYMIFSSMIA